MEQSTSHLTFKCLKRFAPSYLSSHFTFTHATHSHGTQGQTFNALVPSWKVNSGKRTVHFRATKLWNDLEYSVRG